MSRVQPSASPSSSFGGRRLRRRVDNRNARFKRALLSMLDESSDEDCYFARAAALAAVSLLESSTLRSGADDMTYIPRNSTLYEKLIEDALSRRSDSVLKAPSSSSSFSFALSASSLRGETSVYPDRSTTSGNDSFNAAIEFLSGLPNFRAGPPSSTIADDGSSMGIAEYLSEDSLSSHELLDEDLDDQIVANPYFESMPPLSRVPHARAISLLPEDICDFFEQDPEFLEFMTDMLRNGLITAADYERICAMTNPPEISKDDLPSKFNYQAIPWPEGFEVVDRARRRRLSTYLSYANMSDSRANDADIVNRPYTNEDIVRFQRMYTQARPQLTHFQLRNLIAPVTKNNVFHSDVWTVKKLDGDTGQISEVMNRANAKTGTGQCIKISTISASKDAVVAGGYSGQYMYKSLNTSSDSTVPTAEGIVTTDINNITNHADITPCLTKGTPQTVFSCNDSMVRILDLDLNKLVAEHPCPWAVNWTATSPCGKLRVVVGDSTDTLIMDAESGGVIASVGGHKDYSFSCAWSNDGHTVATGNQDLTCRIYDFRKYDQPLHVLGAQMGAIRSVKFNKTGNLLAMAEPVDYVHLLNTRNFDRGQIIDFWGEIAGIGFSSYADLHADDSLWIGNSDSTVGGLMHFESGRGSALADPLGEFLI